MNKIKLLIKEELLSESKNYIIESFKPLSKTKDINKLLESFITIKHKLINEGYTDNEINVILEQSGILNNISNNLSQGITGAASDLYKKTDIGKTLTDAGLNMVKSQIVYYLLTTLGVNKELTEILTPVLLKIPPQELLMLFKTEQSCLKIAPKLSDGLMIGIINYMQFGSRGMGAFGEVNEAVNWDNVAKSGVGNVIGELISQSNIGELISNKFCKTIWENGNNQE